MEITEEMLNPLALPRWLRVQLQSKILEYPEKDSQRRYVLQAHWRGRSVHFDLRFEMNDHLVGFTLLNPYGAGTPEVTTVKEAKEYARTHKSRIEQVNKGGRAEEKARQPKVWLEVEGEFEPGEVGATAEKVGVIAILDKGHFWEGAHKPYFYEVFLKSDTGFFPKDRYVRIVFRGLRVPVLDPETKKPIPGQYEIMWRVMQPGDQTAYALKRGMKEGWKPPEGVIPIPPDQRKGELWEAWLEYMGKKAKESLVKGKFTIHMVSWRGQFVIRGVPVINYYLRLDDGRSKILSWHLTANPARELPVGAYEEGRVARKWLDYEGPLEPGSPYNPNKELIAYMTIIDRGTVDIQTETDEKGRQVYLLRFNGDELKKKLRLVQEEKGASTWILEEAEELSAYPFVLHYHEPAEGTEMNPHWDLRWKISDTSKEEFNIYCNPIELKEEEPCKARHKLYREEPAETVSSWMQCPVEKEERYVRGVGKTYITCLDSGTLNVIEETENFISLQINGQKLKGYFVAKKEEGGWIFMRSRLPKTKEKESEEKEALELELKKAKLELIRKILEMNKNETVSG